MNYEVHSERLGVFDKSVLFRHPYSTSSWMEDLLGGFQGLGIELKSGEKL